MHPLDHPATGDWSVSIPLLVLLFVLAILYLRGWFRIHFPSAKLRRFFSFLAGLVSLWTALASPLASAVHRFLAAHMLQHLLLMTIAPALILLGDPLRVLRQALPSRLVEPIAPAFRLPPFPHIGNFLVNPVVGWLAATAALMVWHVPAIFSRSFASHAVHQFEQFTFVFAGFLFWWPVIEPWPSNYTWPRWLLLPYLFLATLPCDILSAYLTFCDRVIYAPYLHFAAPDSALRDQVAAGALMWTSITIIYLLPAVLLTVGLLGRQSREI